MAAGFAAALAGDFFLVVKASAKGSPGFLAGVACFSLAQILWTCGQMREARADLRAFTAVFQQDERRADHVVMADGVPVVPSAHPPETIWYHAISDDGPVWPEDATIRFTADFGADFRGELLAEPPVRIGQIGGDFRAEEGGMMRTIVEIVEILVVGGKILAFLVADGVDVAFQRRKETSFVFKGFRKREKVQAGGPLEIDRLETRTVAVL
jgi:hypothetical protein